MNDPKLQRLLRNKERALQDKVLANAFAYAGVGLVEAARATVLYEQAKIELAEYVETVEKRKVLFCGSKL